MWLFFCSADGCCVEFRLASCGQDSQLKIRIVSQREGAGRPTPSACFLSLHLPWETRREREPADCFNLEIALQNRGILLVCGINQLQTDSLIMDHFKTFCWNTAAAEDSVWVSVCVRKSGAYSISTETFISCTTDSRTRTFRVCSEVV